MPFQSLDFAFEGADLFQESPRLSWLFEWLGVQKVAHLTEHSFFTLHMSKRGRSSERLNAPHAGGHAPDLHGFQQANLSSGPQVRAVTEFKAILADLDHPYVIAVFVAEEGQRSHLERHTDRVFSASFSLDGTFVVTANVDGTAQIWDAATGHPLITFQGHLKQGYFASFSLDGRHVMTASHDKTVQEWEVGLET